MCFCLRSNSKNLLGIVDYFKNSPNSPQYLINLSTIGPTFSTQIEDDLKNTEILFVECPITGGVLRTKQKKSSFLCGCEDKSLLEPIIPLLKNCYLQRELHKEWISEYRVKMKKLGFLKLKIYVEGDNFEIPKCYLGR